jgi:hypothetical protein
MGVVTVAYPSVGQVPQNLGQMYWTDGFTVNLSSSYATGGDTITPAQLGFGARIRNMLVQTINTSQTSFFLFVLNTSQAGASSPVYTIQAFTAASAPGPAAALAEVQAGTDLHLFTFEATFTGI